MLLESKSCPVRLSWDIICQLPGIFGNFFPNKIPYFTKIVVRSFFSIPDIPLLKFNPRSPMIKTCLESYHQIQPISLDLGVAPLFIFVNQSKKNLVKGNVSQIRAFKVTRMSQFMRHECLKEVILLHKLLAYYNRNMVWHHEWNENRNYILYYIHFINYNNQLLLTNIEIL